MYKDEKYVNGAFHMPDFENTTTKQKNTKEFAISVGEWLYHIHMNDKTAIPASLAPYFRLFRLYAEGNQPLEIYKKSPKINNSTDPLDMYDRDVKRKGLNNQNDKVISLMPKFMSFILSILNKTDFDVQCDAVDPVSGSEEESNMMWAWMRKHYGNTLDNISMQNGLPPVHDEMLPEDSNDLKQLRMQGAYKPEHAIEIEEVIKHIFNISKWDEEQSERFSLEALTTGWICGYSDYDHEEKSEKIYFSYPEDTIKQHSKSRMYGDSDFDGVVVDYPISKLRLIFPDEPINTWMNLAKKFQGYTNNPTVADFGRWTSEYKGYGTPWDEFNVPVLIFNWVDIEKEEKVKYKTKRGKTVVQDKDKTIEALHKPGNLFTHRRRVKYGGKWVIGTDHLAWDYGRFPNQPKKLTRPLSSVFVYKFPYKALVPRTIPLMDDLQFAWIKYNDAMAKAFPGAIAIDISMINNVSKGKNNEEDSWVQVIKNMYNTGILTYMPNPINIHQTAQNGGIPISEVPSTVLKALSEYLNVINQIVLLFETFTGFSPVFLGGTPTDKQAVKNTELSYNSTLKSLQHIIDGKSIFKQAMAEYCAERTRILFEADEETRKRYESVIGVEGVEIIRMAKKRQAQYGFKMVARPTDEEKQRLIERINLSYKHYQEGRAGINSGQLTRAMEYLTSGINLGLLGRILDSWEKKRSRELEEERARGIQLQSQEVMKQDQNRSMLEDKANDNKFRRDVALSDVESNNKMNEIDREKGWEFRIKQAENEKEKEENRV
jgi:hypothetical protein